MCDKCVLVCDTLKTYYACLPVYYSKISNARSILFVCFDFEIQDGVWDTRAVRVKQTEINIVEHVTLK